MTELRLATPSDKPAIYDFGRTFWNQTLYAKAGIEYDRETVFDVIQLCMDEGVAILAEDGEKIVGMILVLVFPFLMNRNHKVATEWVFYVDPEYRREGIGDALIGAAEALLKLMNVTLFNMVNLQNVTPESAAKLYEKQGFALAETTYLKDIQ